MASNRRPGQGRGKDRPAEAGQKGRPKPGAGRKGRPNEAGRTEKTVENKHADRLEGRNPVKEALRAGRTIDKAWVAKAADGRYDHALYELMRDLKEAGTIVVETDKQRLDEMSETFNHQGIIVQTAMKSYVDPEDLLALAADRGEAPFLLVLDRIQDAYNLGSVLRIADACGAHGVIIPERRAVGLNALTAKASAGAIEHVPVARVTNLTDTVIDLKKKGLWIAGADMAGESLYQGSDLTGPLAIVLGNEGDGIGQGLLKHCDFVVSIPMAGRVNSLNAAVACGIIAFEAVRQRHLK